MSAATAARDGKRSEGQLKSYPVAATTKIWKDTAVGVNSSGYLVSMLHTTASLRFVGFAIESVDNNTGADGDKSCRVRKHGEFEVVYLGGDATEALVGQEVYAVDNQTVDEDPANATNEYRIGEVVEFISTTKLRIKIDRFTGKKSAETTIAALTDNSGGAAADGTIGAVTLPDLSAWNGSVDPTAVQATAIRAAITALTDAVKELSTESNLIVAALKSAGILAQ